VRVLAGLAIWAMLGAACATSAPVRTPHGPAVEIDGVKISNQLRSVVTDVELLALASGDFVSCGTILPDTSCSTSFPGKGYSGGKMRISWKEQGVPKSTGDFVLDTGKFRDRPHALWVEVIVFAPGQAGARLVQQPGSER